MIMYCEKRIYTASHDTLLSPSKILPLNKTYNIRSHFLRGKTSEQPCDVTQQVAGISRSS